MTDLALGVEQTSSNMLDRLRPERLAAKHTDIERYAKARRLLVLPRGLYDLRAVIHAHCFISHDSLGTLEQFIAAAKATGTQVVLMSDHLSENYDYFKDGFGGWHDGVLFFPGAEFRGALLYPRGPLDLTRFTGQRELFQAVIATGGLAFASHIEKWPAAPWDIPELTGTEIYNTHFEAKKRPEFGQIVNDLAKLLELIQAIEQYPHEAFGAIQSHMEEYLAKFDRQTLNQRTTGVAANDSHAYHGLIVKGGAVGQAIVAGVLGEKLGEFSVAALRKLGLLLPADLAPGQEAFHFVIDSYERSFKHVGTHILAPSLDEDGVLAALRQGHAYVAFDWIANPNGLLFSVALGANRQPVAIMGDELELQPGLKLEAQLSLPALIRLICNGVPVDLPQADVLLEHFAYQVTRPGVYRLEAWLPVGDEVLPWIYTNPIYIR